MKRLALITLSTALPPLAVYAWAFYAAQTRAEPPPELVGQAVLLMLALVLAPAMLVWLFTMIVEAIFGVVPDYPILPHQEEILFFAAIPFSIFGWWCVGRWFDALRRRLSELPPPDSN